jgi:phage/conjugal plasmid C-4 type zinc finger TraR family protein
MCPSELEEVAAVLEQAERDAGVAEVRKQLPSGPGSIHCHDCGEVIPEARRQAFPSVKTCVPCQSLRDGTSYHRQ